MEPDEKSHYLGLIKAVEAMPALPVAVVHPCDAVSLAGALQAAAHNLIAPVLIGPPQRIAAAAQALDADISAFPLIASEHSHDSAARGVALAREGKVAAIMKGSLHTDEVLGAVLDRDAGIRTDRRLSHCFVMDVPGHPEPLIISDAAINIVPDLAAKADIARNAIDLAYALRFAEVRVAVLSAMETVNPKVPSTIEAAALCKMADRGQIKGALIDGPLALDNAIDPEAARIKGIVSRVAGRANVLIVPDLDAGNMLAKSLTFLANANAAGIVMGARVPVILTSRADSVTVRQTSCAVAVLAANAGATAEGK
jgi:phosphate acetyltransferase